MKKHPLRIFALITALLLSLTFFGCLVSKETGETSEETQSGEVKAPEGLQQEDESAAPFDMAAIAIELGDVQITAGEVRDTFDQYVSMFAYSYGYDAEMLEQYLRMTEEWLIEYYVPLWKAPDFGITLSADEEAEIEADADRQTNEERDEILLLFASEVLDTEDEMEDVSALTPDQLTAVIEAINEELVYMFEDDTYTFDRYLKMRQEGYALSARVDLIVERMQEQVRTNALENPTAIDEWYEKELASQKEQFDADPTLYLDYQNSADLYGDRLCLYVPTDAARLEIIRVAEDTQSEDTLKELEASMKALEAEYGALKLNGENEERQAEIETEYAELKEQYETTEANITRSAQNRIDSAYADLQGGMSFEDAMNAYNNPDENGSGRISFVVLLNSAEPDYPELAEAAAALQAGEYSQAIQVGEEYYIVRLVERIPAGVVDRALIEEDIREAIKTGSAGEDVWNEQFDAWFEEAKEAAVYHRETYASVVDAYLFDY